jgi:hypothetical protein
MHQGVAQTLDALPTSPCARGHAGAFAFTTREALHAGVEAISMAMGLKYWDPRRRKYVLRLKKRIALNVGSLPVTVAEWLIWTVKWLTDDGNARTSLL